MSTQNVNHCGRQNNTPNSQSCPHPNLRSLLLCYVTWQVGIKVAGGVKVANQLPLAWESLDYPGEPNLITRVFTRGRQKSECQSQREI